MAGPVYVGSVKSFNPEKGWGHIECAETFQMYNKDIFLLRSQLQGAMLVNHGAQVSFKIIDNGRGPEAVDVTIIDPSTAAPVPKTAKPTHAGAHHKGFGGYQGVIKSFNPASGWGHITCPHTEAIYGKDIFFMKSQVPGGSISKGTSVTFSVVDGLKGPEANDITPIGGAVVSSPPQQLGALSQLAGVFPSWNGVPSNPFYGSVKSFNEDKGWGHITCSQTQSMYGKDMFVMRSALNGNTIKPGDSVQFHPLAKLGGKQQQTRGMRCRRWMPVPVPWFEAAKETQMTVKSPCRICHSLDETREDPLVAPCHCDGSLRFVHVSCQQDWLRYRRGPRSFTCELCRAPLACRLTWQTRFEVAAVCLASAVVWAVQAASTAKVSRLAVRLLVARWRQASADRANGGPSLRSLPPRAMLLPASAVADCRVEAAFYLALVVGVVLCAHSVLAAFRRPLWLFGEDVLSRFCIVKIGGSVLLLLHEMLWAFPPVQRVAPPPALLMIGATLLLDTVLLAFFRIPREDRGTRAIVPSLVHGTFRLLFDFLPFAAVFFLWSASIAMIVAASVVPCLALLFHEAARDVRRRRQQHGSVQAVLMVLRAAVRLTLLGLLECGAASRAWAVGDRLLVAVWLCVEGALLWDHAVGRRGSSCARETPSQVFWTAAVLGQLALAGLEQLCGLGPAAAPGRGLRGGQRAGGLQGLLRRAPAGDVAGGLAAGWQGAAARPGAQEAALILTLALYLGIHASVFSTWAAGVRRAAGRALSCLEEPDRVVFYDCAHHRGH